MLGLLSPTRALWRSTLFLLWTALVVPPYAVLMGIRVPNRWLARVYWRGVAAAIGLRVVAHGRPSPARPLLILSNHTSYLDIVALGSLVEGGFVAKSEVGTWPGFGTIARLGRTVFVERKRASSQRGGDAILARLVQGEPLILFPEGTSNDGNRVLPFKSALLAVAEPTRLLRDRASTGGHARETPVPAPKPGKATTTSKASPPVTIQPVSLAYTRLDGVPAGYGWRPFFAWYGDMGLIGHLWTLLGLGEVTVEVVFHAPLTADSAGSRKALAQHCQRVVTAGTTALLGGRGVVEAALLGQEAGRPPAAGKGATPAASPRANTEEPPRDRDRALPGR